LPPQVFEADEIDALDAERLIGIVVEQERDVVRAAPERAGNYACLGVTTTLILPVTWLPSLISIVW
jgi:hypothetical protein